MWFRNLQIYRLTEKFDTDPEALHEALTEKTFKPCAGLDTYRSGWVTPLGKHGESLVHATNGRLMICLQREERILPASVIRDAVEEKVEAIEAAESRPVGRKEKNTIKEEVVVDLLPRAFTRSQRTFAYIDPKAELMILDCATPKKAEDLMSQLRETLGSFKVRPLAVNQAPSAVMTDWLINHAPADFELADECELKEPSENGGIIRVRRQDLGSDEIRIHLDAGKQVTKLAIEWSERISCVLSDDLAIKRLKFMDLVMEEAADVDADDAAARFDADFALMAAELANFLPVVFEQWGGLETSQS